MGDRAFIQIDSRKFDVPIILYGHWSGEDNLTAVRNVLERTDRIGDPSYLVAQLFYEFAVSLGQYDGQLSFGIDVGIIANDVWGDVDTVYVDADTGAYSVGGNVSTEFAVADKSMIGL